MTLPKVLVLGGGPDSEREVSLLSSQGVADALTRAGHQVRREVIDRIGVDELRALGGDVIFPVLHGPWGEGGPMQDVLAKVGKAYVGCASAAARMAMDKMGSKMAAARVGVPTLPAVVLNAKDDEPPVGIPCVVKPVHEGSSVGVHICTTRERWDRAMIAVAEARRQSPLRVNMVEQAVVSPREVTVGVLDGTALPVIEIASAVEFYDYEAKYNRDDTRYVVNPELPAGLTQALQQRALAVAKAIGVRHLCRVDFLIDKAGDAWFLEINTMPGFTSHSLLPMAANAVGLDFAELTSKLVQMALRDQK